MKKLARFSVWLVAAALAGCPLDIEVQSADSEQDDETEDDVANSESPSASEASKDQEYGASCVDDLKLRCAKEGVDDETCVKWIVAECANGSGSGGGQGEDADCGDTRESDDACKQASEKCQYLKPQECDDLLAQVCGDEGVEPSTDDGCWSAVVSVCKEANLTEKDCDALLIAKCGREVAEPVEEPVDSSCYDKAWAACEELALDPGKCKEWVVSVCEPVPPPPPADGADEIASCIKAGKDPEACKNGA